MARIDAAIAERARRQLGLVTTAQLDTLGCTRAQRRGLAARGTLDRISTNVFAVAGTPPRWKADVLAAVWTAGDGAVASHRAAARLWRFECGQPDAIDVTVPRPRRPRAVSGRLWQSSDLVPDDVSRIGAIPVTSKVRTLIDVAGVVSRGAARTAVDAALRDGLVRREPLERRSQELRRPGRPGPGQVLQLLGADPVTRGRPESFLERRYLQVARTGRLPDPETQRVVVRDGRSMRVDFAYPDQRIVVEVCGHRTHSTRRELAADGARQARLVMEGWRVVFFTYDQVMQHPSHVVSQVRQLVEQPPTAIS